MSEPEERTEAAVNVLLQEPEIVAWLQGRDEDDGDDDAPLAA